MKEIPLRVESVRSLRLDSHCKRCALSSPEAVRACFPASSVGDGRAKQGTLFVALPHPVAGEGQTGIHASSRSGLSLRRLLEKNWGGRIVFDWSAKCAPMADVNESEFAACAPYSRRMLEAAKPDRILVTGGSKGFAGFFAQVDSVDLAWSWIDSPVSAPVVFVDDYRHVMASRHRAAAFEAQIEYALTEPLKRPRSVKERRIRPGNVDEFFVWLRPNSVYAYDFETVGLLGDPDFRPFLLTVARHDSRSVWIWDRAALDNPITREAAAEFLADARFFKTAHNKKFDDSVAQEFFGVRQIHGACTMMRAKMFHAPARVGLAVQQLAVGMAGGKRGPEVEIAEEAKRLRKAATTRNKLAGGDKFSLKRDPFYSFPRAYAYEAVTPSTMRAYGALDSYSTARLAYHQQRRTRTGYGRIVDRSWREHVSPLTDAVRRMERVGVKVNRIHAKRLQETLDTECDVLYQKLLMEADINWNSGPQLARLLYEDIGLPVTTRTEHGNPSTNKGTIERLSARYAPLKNLLEWRTLDKLRRDYAYGLERFVRADGRIHTNYKIHGTETTRLSSEHPNLQNIPTRSKAAKQVKDLFMAESGWLLLQGDYSQLEIRIAAMLSNDAAMRKILASGVDFHLATAQMIAPALGFISSEITKEHPLRSQAKTVNFGILYGKTARTLAKDLDVSVAVATSIMNAIFGGYPGLAKWIKEREIEAFETGGVWVYRPDPLSGEIVKSRWRALPNITARAKGLRINARNAAVNTPIQGTGSEYCTTSIRVLDRVIEEQFPNDVRMILTVHDSVIFEVRRTAVNRFVDVAKPLMEGWPSDGIKLPVDFEIGRTWGSLAPLDL